MRRRAVQLATLDPIQRSRNHFEVRIIVWGFITHTLVQLTYINCPLLEFSQRVLSIFAMAILWLFPLLLPAVWERHRSFLISTFKMAFFTFPNLRKPAGIQVGGDVAAPQQWPHTDAAETTSWRPFSHLASLSPH